MGWLNVAVVNVSLYLAFLLHTALNLAHEWLIVGLVLTLAAALVSDEHPKAVFGIIRAYYKSKVDLRSWFVRKTAA